MLIDQKVPFDKLQIVDSIPMDPRHHSKVEYDMLREIIFKSEKIGESNEK